MINDVIIIGGGASGLCAGVYLKQINPELSVRILESQPRVGKKLSVTGNGRCNITNRNISLSRYHGKNPQFASFALSKYNLEFTEKFFEKIGVMFAYEEDKAYPASFQAPSVVDCLRFAADDLGIFTNLETEVTAIQLAGGNYKIICNKISFYAKKVIIACGLLSGGERYGCGGKMLELLKKAGFKIVDTKPSIVQIKTETDIVRQLKGIKTDATVKLLCDGEKIRSDFGEVLFSDYGLSGPPVLQVSGGISHKGKHEISLDIMPQKSSEEIFSILVSRAEALKNRTLNEFFTGMLNKRIGQVLLKLVGCRLNERAQTLDTAKLKKLANLFKDWRFAVTGTTGFANSQATSGGLDTSAFCERTMESKESAGLYAIGEILDIDGDCGGFNLQWAWSSAFCAADSIKESLK